MGGENMSTRSVESITDNYTKGRTARFRKWLVSGPDLAALENPNTPTSTAVIPDDEKIILVGDGTLGSDSDAASQVTAGLIEIPKDPSQADTVPSGRAAWWIGDEGTKARIDLRRLLSAPADAQFQIRRASTILGPVKIRRAVDKTEKTPLKTELGY
jgi:hypothetical protein